MVVSPGSPAPDPKERPTPGTSAPGQSNWPPWFPKDMNKDVNRSQARYNAARSLAASAQTLILDQQAQMHNTTALLHEADAELKVRSGSCNTDPSILPIWKPLCSAALQHDPLKTRATVQPRSPKSPAQTRLNSSYHTAPHHLRVALVWCASRAAIQL